MVSKPVSEAVVGCGQYIVDLRVCAALVATLPRDLQAQRGRHRFDGLGEREVVDGHHETQRGAVRLAAKAMVVAVRVDVEGRRLLIMERAKPNVVRSPPS